MSTRYKRAQAEKTIMNFYTIIFKFKGGTNINQMIGSIAKESCIQFLEELDIDDFSDVISNDLMKIQVDLRSTGHEPILLKGLKNIWYTSTSVNERFAEFNIILTDSK